MPRSQYWRKSQAKKYICDYSGMYLTQYYRFASKHEHTLRAPQSY